MAAKWDMQLGLLPLIGLGKVLTLTLLFNQQTSYFLAVPFFHIASICSFLYITFGIINNLICKSIPKKTLRNTERDEFTITVFANNLEIPLGSWDRAHCLGRKRRGCHQLINVIYLNYKSKVEVLSNAPTVKALASPKVWISEDCTPRIQTTRIRLSQYASQSKDDNIRYHMAHDKLHAKSQTHSFHPLFIYLFRSTHNARERMRGCYNCTKMYARFANVLRKDRRMAHTHHTIDTNTTQLTQPQSLTHFTKSS